MKYISKEVSLPVAIPGIRWIYSNVNVSENIKGITRAIFAMSQSREKMSTDQQ
jgi:hypothetical protein